MIETAMAEDKHSHGHSGEVCGQCARHRVCCPTQNKVIDGRGALQELPATVVAPPET